MMAYHLWYETDRTLLFEQEFEDASTQNAFKISDDVPLDIREKFLTFQCCQTYLGSLLSGVDLKSFMT